MSGKKFLSLVVVSLVTIVSISACGLNASDAARVGENKLAIKTVLEQSQTVDDLSRAVDKAAPDGAQVNRSQVAIWIEEQLTARVAQSLKISVTDAQVDKFLASVAQQSGVSPELFAQQFAVQQGTWVVPSQLNTFTRTYLTQQKIKAALLPKGTPAAQSAALSKALGKVAATVGVFVSPRYGSWDQANVRVAGLTNDLSTPGRVGAPNVSNPDTAPNTR
ncbi:unannotated protein [freshwater metagenome]|uniref:Unannotated protein n=1 Tax=freshwater metagenome TaxID=449393 RepID=A0A6J7DMJ8_9ZZZZ